MGGTRMSPAAVLPRRSRRLMDALRQLREARQALIADYHITEAAELKRLIERLEAIKR